MVISVCGILRGLVQEAAAVADEEGPSHSVDGGAEESRGNFHLLGNLRLAERDNMPGAPRELELRLRLMEGATTLTGARCASRLRSLGRVVLRNRPYRPGQETVEEAHPGDVVRQVNPCLFANTDTLL
jgi:hypothetical protein